MEQATGRSPSPPQESTPQHRGADPISTEDRQEIEKLYDAIRKRKAQLVSPDGESRFLPESLYSFLVELISLLSNGKSVYLAQNQANLTTVEAAGMIGVSRQFLVNLLKKGEIPYHMVGTHRRIYAQDLLAYKEIRDKRRREIIQGLTKSEAAAGLYDRIPAVIAEDED